MVISAQTTVENLLTQNPRLDEQLDRIGDTLQGFVRAVFASQGRPGIRARNFLNGVWLGHPLHAVLTDVPIGAWTGAMLFDYLGALTGSRTLKGAGDWSVGLGVLSGIAAGAAGLADYSEMSGEPRRFGTAHAILNVAGLVLFAMSLFRRLTGRRAEAIPLSTLGYAFTFLAADLGGTMVYRYGATINRQAWKGGEGPRQFKAVLPSSELEDGQKRSVQLNGVEILLARVNGRVYAIGNTCTHEGCPLAEGELVGPTIRCGCHGSEFSLADGGVLNGPASIPEPSFDVREQKGQIEVRRRPY